ncbi:MAG TPA: glycosyltransferase family protein, partial [Polyangiales bacterium]|nr:glycosyltransferase family protein [Polyangiales bacterium]
LPLRKERTTLVPPVLRPEILEARASAGDHLLVYQTAEGNEALPAALAASGLPCRIYGMRRELEAEEVQGNLRYRPFDERAFIADMASARAVVSGGSFTVMSECVYLHKPLLSLPVAGQIEQVVNARYLEREGYGALAEHLDAPTLSRFLHNLPRYEARLASYRQDGNRILFQTLERQLELAQPVED